ncbi:MAG: metallopeptidase TldD-related protein [Bacillus subtilis]|nr:metallopeptidase TldD-related protein [Bacillus subtilis]
MLKGKLGQTIGSSLFTLGRRSVPEEERRAAVRLTTKASPRSTRKLIKEGVLATYLHNLNTAKKDGVKSTGNGFGHTPSRQSTSKVLPGRISLRRSGR